MAEGLLSSAPTPNGVELTNEPDEDLGAARWKDQKRHGGVVLISRRDQWHLLDNRADHDKTKERT
jgi:hypothetical protein